MITLRIKELKTETILGVYDWEKKAKRPVVLNIQLLTDTPEAARTDAMEDAVDYAALEAAVLQKLAGGSWQLIESLVTEVAALILGIDKRIHEVTVEADKPGALGSANSVSASVTLKR